MAQFDSCPDIHSENFFEVIIVGGGTCGLAVASRLCENAPGSIYTEEEHQRFHWLKSRGTRVSTIHKGMTKTSKYVAPTKLTAENILALDALSDHFMGGWDNQFRSCQIPHLRSPMFFHPDPVNIDGMITYAHSTQREKDLMEIQNVVGKEYSKHQIKRTMKKKSNKQPAVIGDQEGGKHNHDRSGIVDINMRDWRDYYRPSTPFFRDFCNDLIDRYNLHNVVRKDEVVSMKYTDLHIYDRNYVEKGFVIRTESGKTYGCKTCVVASGHRGKVNYPIKGLGEEKPSLDASCHTTDIFYERVPFPHPRLMARAQPEREKKRAGSRGSRDDSLKKMPRGKMEELMEKESPQCAMAKEMNVSKMAENIPGESAMEKISGESAMAGKPEEAGMSKPDQSEPSPEYKNPMPDHIQAVEATHEDIASDLESRRSKKKMARAKEIKERAEAMKMKEAMQKAKMESMQKEAKMPEKMEVSGMSEVEEGPMEEASMGKEKLMEKEVSMEKERPMEKEASLEPMEMKASKEMQEKPMEKKASMEPKDASSMEMQEQSTEKEAPPMMPEHPMEMNASIEMNASVEMKDKPMEASTETSTQETPELATNPKPRSYSNIGPTDIPRRTSTDSSSESVSSFSTTSTAPSSVHSMDESPTSTKPHLVVIGGGLTSAQLAHVACLKGIHVTLVLRGPVKIKHFDFHLDWVTKYRNVKKSAFYMLDTDEERAQLILDARGGGSINPEYHMKINKHQAAKRLSLMKYTTMENGKFDEVTQTWNMDLVTREEGMPVQTRNINADYVICATGISPDLHGLGFLDNIIEDYPIDIVGGFPCLTDDLQWCEELPLYMVGKNASLRIGPTSANLDGARTGAERVGWKIQEDLVKEEKAEDDTRLQLASNNLNWYTLLSEA